MKNLLKMSDLTPGELTHILDVADQLKAQQKLGGTAPLLAGKTVAMLFSKASTRTRTSFEVGVYQMGGLLAGMQVTCVCPEAYRPAADVLMLAHKYGSQFHFTSDPVEGVRDADVVATAVWNTAAPGTAESEQRLRDFVGFQLTGKLLEAAKPDAMVLHCLPAHRGEEISTAVFEQHADEIFDEAENRLHVQKAVLAILLAGK